MQRYRQLFQRPLVLIGGLAIVAGLALAGYSLIANSVPMDGVDATIADEGLGFAAEEPAPAQVSVVYISGAVVAPDVYQLPADARLNDLVVAAGGLSESADMVTVNLAQPIADGEHFHIPERSVAPTAAEEGTQAESGGAGGAGGDLISLNSADVAELDTLPGVGPAFAERIVAHRAANGPFQSVEDLRDVEGIGASLLAKITPLVTVGR